MDTDAQNEAAATMMVSGLGMRLELERGFLVVKEVFAAGPVARANAQELQDGTERVAEGDVLLGVAVERFADWLGVHGVERFADVPIEKIRELLEDLSSFPVIELEFAHRSVGASGPQLERFSIVVQGSANRWGFRQMGAAKTFASALFKDLVWFLLTLPIVMQQSTVLLALTNFHASPVCSRIETPAGMNSQTMACIAKFKVGLGCTPVRYSNDFRRDDFRGPCLKGQTVGVQRS